LTTDARKIEIAEQMSQLQIELDAAFAERKKASKHWTEVIKGLKKELLDMAQEMAGTA
jgi:hypothetical protein